MPFAGFRGTAARILTAAAGRSLDARDAAQCSNACSLDTTPAPGLTGSHAAALRAPNDRDAALPRHGGDGARLRDGARGRDVIHLELGEPDFPAHPAAGKACIARSKARPDPLHGQPRAYGTARRDRRRPQAPLRCGRRSRADHRHQRHLARDAAGLLAVGRPGGMTRSCSDRPTIPCYPNFIRMSGGVPVVGPDGPRDGAIAMDVEAVRAALTPRTRAIVVSLLPPIRRVRSRARRRCAELASLGRPDHFGRDLRRPALRRREGHVGAADQ